MGQMTAAYQMTEVDYPSGTKDQSAQHYGVSVAINDSFSVSAGQQNVEFGTVGAKDETNSGIGASYTMGSISMYGGFNKLENANGASASEDVEASIFNISFAF